MVAPEWVARTVPSHARCTVATPDTIWVMSILSASRTRTSPVLRVPAPVVDSWLSASDAVVTPAPDWVSPVLAADESCTMTRSPVRGAMAPNVCAYWACGNGTAPVPGLRMTTSPGPAWLPSLTVIVVADVLLTLAARVPAVSWSTVNPHVPVIQIAACGVAPGFQNVVLDRSTCTCRTGKPGFRFSGYGISVFSGRTVPCGDSRSVRTCRSHWSSHTRHG